MITLKPHRFTLAQNLEYEIVKAAMPGVTLSRRDARLALVPPNAVITFRAWLASQSIAILQEEAPAPVDPVRAPAWYAEQAAPVMAKYKRGEWETGKPIYFGPPWRPGSMLAVPFQLAGVARLVDRRGAVFHWPTGTGKTVGAILALLRLGATRIVWSVPNSAITQTAARISQFTGYEAHVWKPPSTRRKRDESLSDYTARMVAGRQPRVLLVIPENIGGLLDAESFQRPAADMTMVPPRLSLDMVRFLAPAGLPGPCLLVLDEVHNQASHKRFRRIEDLNAVDDAGDTPVTYERRDNLAAIYQFIAHQDHFTHRLGMTATIIPDRVRGMFAMYDLIFPKCFGSSYWDYARRYCGARANAFGGLDDTSATHVEELNQRRAWMTHRPSMEEVKLQMPPKIYTMRFIPRAVQKRLQLPAEYAADRRALEKLGKAGGQGNLIFRLFQASLLVNEELTDDVLPRVQRGEKVLVMCQHRAVAHAYQRLLERAGVSVWSVITGETHPDPEERARTISEWEASAPGSVLIGTGGAIGTGVDFRVASYLAMIELPFRPLDITQQAGRIGRMGTVQLTEVAFYLPEGTAAERVHSILLSKLPVAAAVNQDSELDGMLTALEGRGDDDALVNAFLADTSTLDFGDSDD